MPVLKPNDLIDTLAANLRAYHSKFGVARAELDLSGGIDSAVMLGLLTLALGANNITTAFLGINSNPDALSRAQGLADALGVKFIAFDGTDLFNLYVTKAKEAMVVAGYSLDEIDARIAADSTILGSIRSTLRAPWGRGFCRLAGNGIRHGTGNECEDRWLRFFQKGGDGEVDTNPISMLSKGEIYQLARVLGVRLDAMSAFGRIINAVPSADLWGVADAHNDQNEIVNYLGVSGYPVYSYLNEDGSYRTVGLIERVSRFLDSPMAPSYTDNWNSDSYGEGLFADESHPMEVADIIEVARTAPEFKGIAPDDVASVLKAARKIERVTRHKMNPNCPAITARADLVSDGILTNTLPV